MSSNKRWLILANKPLSGGQIAHLAKQLVYQTTVNLSRLESSRTSDCCVHQASTTTSQIGLVLPGPQLWETCLEHLSWDLYTLKCPPDFPSWRNKSVSRLTLVRVELSSAVVALITLALVHQHIILMVLWGSWQLMLVMDVPYQPSTLFMGEGHTLQFCHDTLTLGFWSLAAKPDPLSSLPSPLHRTHLYASHGACHIVRAPHTCANRTETASFYLTL